MNFQKIVSLKIVGFFLFALCTIVITIGLAKANLEKKPTKWQPIYGFAVKGAKGYIDVNNRVVANFENNQKYNSAEILISYDKSISLTIGNKNISLRGLVRSMAIECKSAVMIPIYDIFFTEPFPTKNSLPVYGIDYTKNSTKNITILNKNSPIYQALCPVYL